MHKILYLSQFSQIGGGETTLLYLISKLDKRKFEAHIILPARGQFESRLKKLKVKIHILKLPPYLIRTIFVPGLSPLALIKLLKLTHKIKPDLIHVNHLTLSLYAGIVAKILKIPTVGTAHGVWDSLYFYQNLIYRFFVNKIIANTEKTSSNIKAHGFYSARDVKTIYFGIDTNLFRPPTQKEKMDARNTLNIPNDHIVVSCVGRLDPQKDHLTFLESAKLVLEKTQKVYFLIVGSTDADFSKTNGKSNYFKTLEKFIALNIKLAKHIKFIPYQENMTNIYWACDIVVSTSSSSAESFGLTLLEAASCQLPIVSTQTASQKLIVKDGKTGFLVPPKRPDRISQKILILAANPKLRQKFGENGRSHITRNFPIEKYTKKVQDLYAKNLGFKVVYATDQPLFNRNKILKMSFSKKYPSTCWLPLLAQELRKNNIEMVTADIAYSKVLQKKWRPQQLIVIQDMDAKDGHNLIKLGAHPCAVISYESPLYAYTFHAKIKKNTSIFKNRILWKGLLKDVSTSKNNYVCYSASYFSEQVISPKDWTDRKFLVLVAANKYFRKNFPIIPKYLTEHLDWIRDQIWIASSPIRKVAIKNELIGKKLEMIEYFGKKKLLDLFGYDWDNLENLPRSWGNRLNQVIPILKPKPIGDKLKTIANYKFAIAFENTSYPGFVAEKMIDCFVAGTIPIYLGAPDITRFVPKNTFIDVRDFDSYELLHQYLTKLKTGEAMQMISNGRKFLKSPDGKKRDYKEFSNFILKIVMEYQTSLSR